MTTDVNEFPPIGSLWAHHNGAQYVVTLHTNVEGTKEKYPQTVVYTNRHNGKIYSRKLSDWHRSMTLIALPPVYPSQDLRRATKPV